MKEFESKEYKELENDPTRLEQEGQHGRGGKKSLKELQETERKLERYLLQQARLSDKDLRRDLNKKSNHRSFEQEQQREQERQRELQQKFKDNAIDFTIDGYKKNAEQDYEGARKDFEQALILWNKTIELNLTDAQNFDFRAGVNEYLDNHEAAAKDYSESLRLWREVKQEDEFDPSEGLLRLFMFEERERRKRGKERLEQEQQREQERQRLQQEQREQESRKKPGQDQSEQEKKKEIQQRLEQEKLEQEKRQELKQEEQKLELEKIQKKPEIVDESKHISEEKRHDTKELNEKDIEGVLLKIESYAPEKLKHYLSKIQSSLVKNTIEKISKDQDPSFIIGKLLELNIHEIERKICQLLTDDQNLLMKFVNSDYCNNPQLNLIKDIVPSLFTGNRWQTFRLETLFKLSNCSNEMVVKSVFANISREKFKEMLENPACDETYIKNKKEFFSRIVCDYTYEKIFDNNLLRKLVATDDDDLTTAILSNHVFCCILAENKYLLNEKQTSILFTVLMTAKNFLRGAVLKHEGLIGYIKVALEYGIQYFSKHSHLWPSFLKSENSRPFHELIRGSLLHYDFEKFISLNDPTVFAIIFPEKLPDKGIYKTLSSDTLLALAEKSLVFSNYILKHPDLLKIIYGNMDNNLDARLKRLLDNPNTKVIAATILARPDTELDSYDVISQKQAEELFFMHVDFARRVFSKPELREKLGVSYETFFMLVANPKKESFCVDLFSQLSKDFTGFVQNAYSLAPEFLRSRIQFYAIGKIIFEQKPNALPFPYHADIVNKQIPQNIIETINRYKQTIEVYFKLSEGFESCDQAISRYEEKLKSLGRFSLEKSKFEKFIQDLKNAKTAIAELCIRLIDVAKDSHKAITVTLIPLKFLQIDSIFNTLMGFAQRNPWAGYFYIHSIELTQIKDNKISEKVNLITKQLTVSLLANPLNKKIIAHFLRTPEFSQHWDRVIIMQIVEKYPDLAKFCFVYPHLYKKIAVNDFIALGKIVGYGETEEAFIKFLQESNVIVENLLKTNEDLKAYLDKIQNKIQTVENTPTIPPAMPPTMTSSLLKQLNSKKKNTALRNMDEPSVESNENVSPLPPPPPPPLSVTTMEIQVEQLSQSDLPQKPVSEFPKSKKVQPSISKPARRINLTNLLGNEAVKKFEKALKINNFTREQEETKNRYSYLVQWVGDIFDNAEFKKAQSEKVKSAEIKQLIENLYSALVGDLTKAGKVNMLNEVIRDDLIASIVSGYEFSVTKDVKNVSLNNRDQLLAQIKKPRQLKSAILGLDSALMNEIRGKVVPEKWIDAQKVLRLLFSSQDVEERDKKIEELKSMLQPNAIDEVIKKLEAAIKDKEQSTPQESASSDTKSFK